MILETPNEVAVPIEFECDRKGETGDNWLDQSMIGVRIFGLRSYYGAPATSRCRFTVGRSRARGVPSHRFPLAFSTTPTAMTAIEDAIPDVGKRHSRGSWRATKDLCNSFRISADHTEVGDSMTNGE
jgi:hypothetical protein